MSPLIVGQGWLGASLGRTLGAPVIPRRQFTKADIPVGATVVVASGRALTPPDTPMADLLRSELDHLRFVLDACEAAGATRVLFLGSSDVAGMAQLVDGQARQDPTSPHGTVMSALEDECLLRRADGLPVTALRLAPVHGPGKRRTRTLVRLACSPMLPLPNGGRHSIGFVLLDDVLRAITWSLTAPELPPIVSIGAGETPLRALLTNLAAAQERHLVSVFVPVPPRRILRAACTPGAPAFVHWLARLAVPRRVTMEAPISVTPLDVAAKLLVTTR